MRLSLRQRRSRPPEPTPTDPRLPTQVDRATRWHPERALTIAHRGASGEAPENTLTAMRRAIGHGADLVEVDVQRTRDGALVLLHDTTLERTTDAARVFPRRAPWRVGDFTYDELSRLDAGSWKGAAFLGERIPLLEDLLRLLSRTGTGLLLELKAPERYPGIVRDVVVTLREQALAPAACPRGPVLLESFSFAAMKEAKVLAPELPVGLLGAPPVANLPVLASWADMVNPPHRLVDEQYVDLVHRLGMRTLLWTVNRPPAMRRALALGADGVITNHPAVLAQVSRRTTRSAGDGASAGTASRAEPASPRTS